MKNDVLEDLMTAAEKDQWLELDDGTPVIDLAHLRRLTDALREDRTSARMKRWLGNCPCECNRGGFCGGCGHVGCSGGINLPQA